MQAAERRQKKTELKREAILRSAAAAFRRKGYHGTSMEDISEQLLMTKGSLYYYFSDKEAILFACHDFSLDRVLEKMREVIEAQKAANSADKLGALIQGLVDVMIDDLQGSALALDFTALRDELLEKIIIKRDQFERGMRVVISEGVKNGEFRNVDPKLATFAILGAINWISKWYRPDGSFKAADIGRMYSDLFVKGLSQGELPDTGQGA
ncbi:MAG: TetR family transcriptional regulator [Planctomycetes bacterium]|nr:TetR family transcriptional regulator [Planctomycetota bacterium]MCA8936578.1 TetR family transcriptional regulator [Planctomycetota bacterium]